MEKKSIEISIVVASEIEKKSLTRDSVFFLTYKCLNSCGKHETKEGKSPVANEEKKILSNSKVNLNEKRGTILELLIYKINR
jgi:hypothetical protein